jgi:hypothetical protein
MTDVLPRGQCVNIKAKRTGAGFAVKGLEGCNPRIAAELKPQASKRRVKWSSHDVEAKVSAQFSTAAIGTHSVEKGRSVTSIPVESHREPPHAFWPVALNAFRCSRLLSRTSISQTQSYRGISISVRRACSEIVAAVSAAREGGIRPLSQRRHRFLLNLNPAVSINWGVPFALYRSRTVHAIATIPMFPRRLFYPERARMDIIGDATPNAA